MRFALAKCLLVYIAWAPWASAQPSLEFPVDCSLGTTCFVQQYVDHDPGPGAKDFTCGPLTYDGHSGTDIRIVNLRQMARGVPVVAAAAGRVLRVRDGMADARAGSPGAPAIGGRDCGNGAVIAHADGWETQYCHLRQGSLRVRPGERVAAGTRIGLVGMSGRAQFPHLHLTLRHDGQLVDPFAPRTSVDCGGDAGAQLWAQPIAYAGGGLLDAGFATDIPAYDRVRAGSASLTALDRDAGALVVWAFYFGPRTGDVIRLTISSPAGIFLREDHRISRTQAQAMFAAGRRRPSEGWAPGRYSAVVEFLRGGQRLGRITREIALTQ